MPTALEDLITAATAHALEATLVQTTQKIAEDIAREMLSDPNFRAYFKTLVAQAFGRAFAELQKEVGQP